jgi:hypothetical protein
LIKSSVRIEDFGVESGGLRDDVLDGGVDRKKERKRRIKRTERAKKWREWAFIIRCVSDKTEQRSAAAVDPMVDFGLIERVEEVVVVVVVFLFYLMEVMGLFLFFIISCVWRDWKLSRVV